MPFARSITIDGKMFGPGHPLFEQAQRDWRENDLELAAEARAGISTKATGYGGLPELQPAPATAALAQEVLGAVAAHLWTAPPELHFVRSFPGQDDTNGLCLPNGQVYIRADLAPAQLVEVVAHEAMHWKAMQYAGLESRGVRDPESVQRQNHERLASAYGRLVRGAWEWLQKTQPGLDFGWYLKAHNQTPELSFQGL